MAGISKEERERRAALANTNLPPADNNLPSADPGDEAQPQTPPMFSVAERRLKFGDAEMLRRRADFDLVGFDKPMSTYWGETKDAYDLINVYGWEPVNQKHLPMKAEHLGLAVSPEGYVTRGTKGSEMLFMMPKDVREGLLHNQAETRMRRRLSARGLKEVQQQAAQDYANNPNLTPAQRERARRQADSIDADQRAKWVPLPSHESHGTEPL